MNCPFYGCSFTPVPGASVHRRELVIMKTGGNQCGLVIDAHSPCVMVPEEDVEWRRCPRLCEARGEPPVTVKPGEEVTPPDEWLDRIPHRPELNLPGGIGCICWTCVAERQRRRQGE